MSVTPTFLAELIDVYGGLDNSYTLNGGVASITLIANATVKKLADKTDSENTHTPSGLALNNIEFPLVFADSNITTFSQNGGYFTGAKGFGENYSTYPGTGAAGGLGFALIAYCKAKFAAGIDIVLNVSGFEKDLEDADLVITGEGRIDGQSVQGKGLYGIGTRAKERNVPVIAIGGAVRSDSEALLDHGITAMFSIANGPLTLEYAMENGCELIEQITKNVIRVFMK